MSGQNNISSVLGMIQDGVIGILNSVDWNTPGLTPEENIKMVEIKSMLINTDNKIEEAKNNS